MIKVGTHMTEALSNTEQISVNVEQYLRAREWHERKAKSSGQSLLAHALTELYVFFNVAPLLNFTNTYKFSEEDYKIIILSIIAHDCGKESKEWQDYLVESDKFYHGFNREKPKYISHINLEIGAKMAQELNQALGFRLEVSKIPLILSLIETHMKNVRKDAGVAFQKILNQKTGIISENWKDLAMLVSFIDDLSSCENVEDAYHVFSRKEVLKEYEKIRQVFDLTYHKVNRIRGISTSLLHKAVEEAHIANFYAPILYFPEGTLYFGLKGKCKVPSNDEMLKKLKEAAQRFISQYSDTNSNIVVGSPNASSISTESLFIAGNIGYYFNRVIRKNREKDTESLEKMVEYLLFKQLLPEFSNLKRLIYNIKKEKQKEFFDNNPQIKLKALKELGIEIERDPDSILKAIQESKKEKRDSFYMNYSLSGDEIENNIKKFRIWLGKSNPYLALFELVNSLIANERLVNNDARVFLIEKVSEKFSFEQSEKEELKKILPVTGKYMPLAYQIIFVDRLEKIFGEKWHDETLKWLVNLFEEAWTVYGFDAKGIDEKIDTLIIFDLAFPSSMNFKQIAIESKEFYKESKEHALSKTQKAKKMCLICNSYFTGENRSISEIIGFSKKFTNRLVGTKTLENVNICKSCEIEYLLRYLTLGVRPEELIVVYPETNTTFELGQALQKKVKELESKIIEINSSEYPDIARIIRLREVSRISEILVNDDNFLSALSVDKLINHTSYRRREIKDSEDKKIELTKIVELFLKEKGYSSVNEINEDHNTSFTSLDDAINAIIKGNGFSKKFMDEVKSKIYDKEKKFREINKDLAASYVTPNFVVIPLSWLQTFNSKEISETDVGFIKLFVSSILSKIFDSSIALLEMGENIPEKPTGVVWIPPIGNVIKSIDTVRKKKEIPIKELWLSKEERDFWINLLACVFVIKQRAKFSERTGVFEVLTIPTEGHLMRRVELKSNYMGIDDLRVLNKIKELEVLG